MHFLPRNFLVESLILIMIPEVDQEKNLNVKAIHTNLLVQNQNRGTEKKRKELQ